VGSGTSSWGPLHGGLSRGSYLVPVLFGLCSGGLPRGRGFVCAGGMCLAIQGQCFGELGCSLLSGVAWMSHFCRRWRLGPGAYGAVGGVFCPCSAGAARGLSVCLDGRRLWCGCCPACLGVALGRVLSCRGHLTGTAGRLGGRDGLLVRLAGSAWGAGALRSSALALCCSAAECCDPAWSCSARASRVGMRLGSAVRLVSGALRYAPPPWLPVLCSIGPPAIWGRDAAGRLPERVVRHDGWPVQPGVLDSRCCG